MLPLLFACATLAPTCDGDPVERYADLDGDGAGAGKARLSCPDEAGWSLTGDDCDDTRADVFPGGVEVPYDDADQDCDGVDLRDVDGDGHDIDDDCDDTDPDVFPGADEVWYDGRDSDCAGDGDYDADGDGYDSARYGGDDCDDADATIHPGAEEVWYDDVDQDCAGDDDQDADADGYDLADDCDDTDASTFPGAPEVCDGSDNNCDDAVDEGYDVDTDGTTPCGGDCDDTSADIGPSIAEVCDAIDNNCDGTIDEGFDGDGDAVSSCAGDCDDADPTVYPDAEEVWYDGLDQDCDGNDDDQDTDGVPVPADCDDIDGSIFPGAAEVPYDGIDQDCDGADLRDVDEDGYDYDVDCDDEDASVHPGAADAWYDGVDANCDGADDYDQDVDGYPIPEDCDDTAPGVYPGAPDTWYDGIDADCAGNSDDDQDADGFDLDVDCDDTDPAFNPGEPDSLDGLDQDCSGTADDPAAEDVAFYAVVGDTGDAAGSGGVRLVPDLDADGDAELVMASPAVDADGGAVWLFSPDELGAETPVSHAWLTITGGSGDQLGASFVAGSDWDADGSTELLLGAPGASAVYLVNPAGESGTRGASALADVTLSGTAGDSFGAAVTVGDFDGDGVDDLAVGAPGAASGKGTVYLFYGDTSSSSISASSANWSAPGADAGDGIGGVLAGGGDQNADGYEDLLLGVPEDDEGGAGSGSAFVLEGSGLLLNLLNSPIDSMAAWSTKGSAAGQALGTAVAFGDVSGTSRSDLLIGVPGYTWSGGTGALAEFDGRASGSDALSTATRLVRADGAGEAVAGGADLSGDGNADLLLGGGSMTWLFTFAGSSGTLDLPGSQLASWSGDDDDLGASLDGEARDLDADGVDDVAIAAPRDAGVVYVLRVFP